MSEKLTINKGTQFDVAGTWSGGASPADAIEVLNGNMQPHEFVTVAWVDAAAGEFTMTFAAELYGSKDSADFAFRLRRTPVAGDPVTSDQKAITLQ